ncbi:MAG: AI-2E family transporter [Calditrichaeota bacterium]|nr:MAG: AI-2E family transporter [Calditrichota bacterium]
MKPEHILTALFFLVASIFFYLFYELIIPFFNPICWAAVFVIIFFPLYERVLKRVKSKPFSSIIVCFLIIILIIGPVAYLFGALVSEAAGAVTKVNEMLKAGELDKYFTINLPWLDSAKEKLSGYYDFSKIKTDQVIKNAIENVSSVILNQTRDLISNITRMIFYFALMIFTMYYFFTDGQHLIDKLKRLMPLSKEQTNTIFKRLRDVIQATMYGGVVVALIQGLIGGILFAAVGIPSAVFWGGIMAFLSIIPFVGAFVVFIPAGIILILGGSYVKGLVVIIIGSVIISQVDNLIRPYLIAGKASMHPLLLFFALLGGVYLFGLLGIVLGPIIAAIFVTLITIFELKLNPEENATPEAFEE